MIRAVKNLGQSTSFATLFALAAFVGAGSIPSAVEAICTACSCGAPYDNWCGGPFDYTGCPRNTGSTYPLDQQMAHFVSHTGIG